MKNKQPAISVTKSYTAGHVSLLVNLKCGGYKDTATIKGRTSVSTETARAIAKDLIDCADKEDAKVAVKLASEERRKQWRDREIAAGRLIVMRTP